MGVALLALAGCTAPAKIAVRLVDGDLAFSICQKASANRIEVSVFADSGTDDEPSLVWSATGPTGSHEQVTFSSDRLPGDSVLDAPPTPFVLVDHQLYLHYDKDSSGEAQSGLFASWDGDNVSSDYWLDANGARHSEWCEAAR